MLVLGREEKYGFMLKAAILSIGELDWHSVFTWSSHTMPCDVGCFSRWLLRHIYTSDCCQEPAGQLLCSPGITCSRPALRCPPLPSSSTPRSSSAPRSHSADTQRQGEGGIAFCNWIFSPIWQKSDYIWTNALMTGLLDLRMYVRMDSPPPHQYILSYHCVRDFFCVFSAELSDSSVYATIAWNWSWLQGDIFPLPLHAQFVHMPSQETETTFKMAVTLIPSALATSTPAAPVAPLPR